MHTSSFMHATRWVNHLRESFAALAAGSRIVPFWDNGAVHRSLALRLTEIRSDPRGCASGETRPRPSGNARDRLACRIR
jgi:hypothetical protein